MALMLPQCRLSRGERTFGYGKMRLGRPITINDRTGSIPLKNYEAKNTTCTRVPCFFFLRVNHQFHVTLVRVFFRKSCPVRCQNSFSTVSVVSGPSTHRRTAGKVSPCALDQRRATRQPRRPRRVKNHPLTRPRNFGPPPAINESAHTLGKFI